MKGENTARTMDAYLGFRKGMSNSKGFEIRSSDGTETWEFGVTCSEHGLRVDVHVEGEGPGEWARYPEGVRWFNRTMTPLDIAFGERDGHFGSFTAVPSSRVEAMERELLRHGWLRSFRVRTLRLDRAPRLIENVPPDFEHEEYSLNVRSLPGEDHSKVRYVEFTACGPHEDGRHGVKALLLMRRGPNRCARWLDREIQSRGIDALEVQSEIPSVHSFALDRDPALAVWRAAACLDAETVGLDEVYFTDAQATWTFAPGAVTLV